MPINTKSLEHLLEAPLSTPPSGQRTVKNRVDRRTVELPRKIPTFKPEHEGLWMEVEHDDFQILKATIMSPNQQTRVLSGMNPGPMGENRPSHHRNKEES